MYPNCPEEVISRTIRRSRQAYWPVHYRRAGVQTVSVSVTELFEAMGRLDDDGYFGRGAAREALLLGVRASESARSWYQVAVRLNGEEALARRARDIPFLLPHPGVEPFGPREPFRWISAAAGGEVLGCCGDGRVAAIETRTGRVVARADDPDAGVADAIPDGSGVVFGNASGISVLPVQGGVPRPLFRPGRTRWGTGLVRVAPLGGLVLLGWGADLLAIDLVSGSVRWSVRCEGRAAAFSMQDNLVAVGSASGNVHVLDTRTGRAAARFSVDPGIAALAWNPGASELVCCTGGMFGGKVVVVDPATGARQAERQIVDPWAVAVSPIGGGRIAVCSEEFVYVLDSSLRIAAKWWGSHRALYSCVFVDGGKSLVAVGDSDDGEPGLVRMFSDEASCHELLTQLLWRFGVAVQRSF